MKWPLVGRDEPPGRPLCGGTAARPCLVVLLALLLPAAGFGGEHPRLLFRAADLPALRERAQTPAGKKIMAELADELDREQKHGFAFFPPAVEHMMFGVWAAGCGFQYQMTGDKQWADRAMGLGIGAMYGVYYYGGWGIHPYQIMGLAMAYDLCYDAWPVDYRNMVYHFLFQNISDLSGRTNAVELLGTRRIYRFANGQEKFKCESSRDFSGQKLRMAAAIAVLALRGDPVPLYKPAPLDAVRVIEPAAGYTPWIGTPVVPFTDGMMPAKWLVNGPFRRGLAPDPLAELGGLAQARPEEGTVVTHDGMKLDFRTYYPAGANAIAEGPHIYPRDCNRFWGSSTGGGYYKGIELSRRWAERLGHRPGVDVTIFTVLNNDRERVVQALPNWRWNSHGIRMWLNGVEVKDGDLVRLKPGLYPWMCHVPVMGGYANQAPHLREYTPAHYDADQKSWELARTELGRDGGELDQCLDVLVGSVRQFMADQIAPDGSGGWNNSIYELLFPFLLTYRHVTGKDLAAGTGVAEFFVQGLRERTSSWERQWPNITMQSFGFLPDKYRPAAVWQTEKRGLGIRRPHEAIMALTTYPYGVSPSHPSQQFALAASLPGHGLHQFANTWDADDGFFVQVEHAPSPKASPYAFGNLGITGLGRTWVPFRLKAYRWEEQFRLNKVTAHDHFHVQGGRLVHSDLRPDGSGVISIVADTFRKGDVVANTGGPGSHIVWDQQAQPQVRMLRSVAVDYSGACGAPALIVVADRISGLTANSEKHFRLDFGGAEEFTTLDQKTKTFVVGRNVKPRPTETGPTLTGSVILPARADCQLVYSGKNREVALAVLVDRRVSDRERVEGGASTDDAILEFDKHLDRQSRAAQTEDRVYLVVITLQRGTPPVVRKEGDKAIVGGVTVAFDGEKVVLAK